ncbi:nucleolar protein 14 homolog [Zerene cesonia]|uniref:nucleolar protein 14 homolog n=1 Tax=Zerene cesonia TaxID=33412 RepID=UPI0018E5620D|nr:nucleolar protein 14 homolog [Zerene cesonia]
MAKVKNKRNAGLADKVHKKKADATKKKLNPFEVHINREKIKVLGKKSKHDRGLPGVSRAKAIQKRKETLGTEMKLINKTNTFIDRRIGEKSNNLSAEDRMIARFAAERAKQHSKKSIYNLADDEVLTHRGQTLEQIEKFDDPRSDDEDEDKPFGGLDNDFVSEGHFGGGILSKTESKDGAKSHKDLIEQLIAESKKRKAEKQKEKEQTLDLTEKLDSEWKDLQPVVFKKVKEDSLIDKLLSKAESGQDYDKMMRELKFDRRGTPSDALKSTEKQKEEERKKLEELEKQRQARMLPEDEAQRKIVQPTVKHRSADDLDDNFELDDEKEIMLAYDKDGKPLVPEHILKDYNVPKARNTFDDGVSDTSSEDEKDEDDEEENESDDEEQKMNGDVSESGDGSDEVEENSDESDNEVEEIPVTPEKIKSTGNKDEINRKRKMSNSEIVTKKAKSEEDESADEVIENHINENNENCMKESTTIIGSDSEPDESCEKGVKSDEDLDDGESDENEDEEVDEAESDENDNDNEDSDENTDDDAESVSDRGQNNNKDENSDDEILGSVFELKSTEGDKLRELLTGKTPSQQSTALQKLIKSYDPSLSENNKEILSRLFAHLLQHVNDLFTNLKEEGDIIKAFLIFDKLAPYFYDLMHVNKVFTKKFIAELLKEKYDAYQKNPRKVPDLDTLIFFKLISLLYPTSDFRHPVTTPSLVFMAKILSECRFNDAYSVSRGLFIVALVLEYTALSKRFVPTAVNFLRGIFYLCANTSVLNPVQVVPPFRLHKDVKILNLEQDCAKLDVNQKMAAKDLVAREIDDTFRIKCLSTSILMLREFFDNYMEMEALKAIFEPHMQLLGRIDLEMYPKKVANIVEKVLQHMKETLETKTYTLMAKEKVKPKALRLYEPDIQEVFTGSKSSKLSRENAQRARLLTKYKREMKGALREIRRDKAYIAFVKIRQKIQSDNVRKEKVKQIYKDAAIQQSELNKLKRMK